jgi:hypothetical protein
MNESLQVTVMFEAIQITYFGTSDFETVETNMNFDCGTHAKRGLSFQSWQV